MNLDERIKQLRTEVILMARKSQAIFARAVDCLNARDEQIVAEVRSLDSEIDDLEVRLDRACVELLALQEPYAFDFRFVFSVIKMIKDFERVGDESKTIAKWAPKLPEPPDENMRDLAGRAGEALATAVSALVEEDRSLAEKVMEIEFTVDAIEDRIIESASSLAEAFIAKALERVGDLATNVAEDVIFTVSAKDVRHGQFDAPES
ncbi:MAG: phosphate signaling complex protein PhoU [bacterium]|nr:phosphate signaling complex protein PhoU [bacterium]